MSGDVDSVYVVGSLVFILLIMILYLINSQLIINKQQRTIDRLTDKLMARDYREYVGLKREEEIDVSPPEEQQEKKGWFDH